MVSPEAPQEQVRAWPPLPPSFLTADGKDPFSDVTDSNQDVEEHPVHTIVQRNLKLFKDWNSCLKMWLGKVIETSIKT